MPRLETTRFFYRASLLLATACMCLPGAPALATSGEQIRIVGSSTVYPFSASVAEHFGKAGDFRTPVVEATGTGAGLKLFCESSAPSSPDIANASRRIVAAEQQLCAKNGVQRVIEVKMGYDGITLANSAKAPRFHLSRKDLFLALARDLPDGTGRFRPNPHTTWKQVNDALPDVPIRVYGMPPVSGTRDTFVELVMEKGCMELPQLGAITNEAERKKHCKLIREDGAFIEVGENGNLIVQKLVGDDKALGVLGFSFLEQNEGLIQASLIENVAPEFETIQSGRYTISRPLYMYVKGEHVPQVAGMSEFVKEFLSEGTIGDEGYLVTKGLIPMQEAERATVRSAIQAQIAGAATQP